MRLYGERPQAALFVGKFWKQRAFEEAERADQAARRLAGGGLSDAALAQMVVTTLEGMGIEVLDQRGFLAPSMVPPGVLTMRAPTEQEWAEIRSGATLARHLAEHGIGQTVVRCFGVTVAVEAIEGTDEAIRRGARLSGPGAVVVKGVARSHDYRFDIPAIGPTHGRRDGRGRRDGPRGGSGACAPRRSRGPGPPGGCRRHRGGEHR